MRRFLVAETPREGTELRLSPEETKHCTRVLRLQAGDRLLLADGKGTEAEAELLGTEKQGALVRVLHVREAPQRPFRLDLLQAPLKGARMDWLVEKACELGVNAIHPIESQFTVAKGEKADRWRRLAGAAAKQSGNPQIPEIHECSGIQEAINRLPRPFRGLLLSPTATQGLADGLRAAEGKGNVALAIGPEGGFSEEEEKAFQAAGFLPCRLSQQILRGETAALAAVAIALHALELKP